MKIVGTPFSHGATGGLLLIVAISILMKRELVHRKLLKRAVQVKEQVLEVVVRRLQI